MKPEDIKPGMTITSNGSTPIRVKRINKTVGSWSGLDVWEIYGPGGRFLALYRDSVVHRLIGA